MTDIANYSPHDLEHAALVGRVWRTAANGEGPSVVVVRNGVVFDITEAVPTVANLFKHPDVLAVARQARGEDFGRVEAPVERSMAIGRASNAPILLAPNDLQAIKTRGVTFAVSLTERVTEEQAGDDPAKVRDVRASIVGVVGSDLSKIKPGSDATMRLKEELQCRGVWSQYMEVGIGPDAEVFSKSQPISAVGFGVNVGLHPAPQWNNPEPEIVLAVSSAGHVVGAAPGDSVNLRNIKGRSTLLLGKCKDNNGSCAIGPFVYLFDERFTVDTIHATQVSLRVEGADGGFVLDGVSHMSEISRDPLDLVTQTCGPHHQYPNDFMLFLGTMFSPTRDRDAPGAGLTHHLGDRVTISALPLGVLINTVRLSTEIAPWTFSIRALYRNLAARGLVRQD